MFYRIKKKLFKSEQGNILGSLKISNLNMIKETHLSWAKHQVFLMTWIKNSLNEEFGR